MESAVRLEHVFFSYQNTPVLRDITFDIAHGEFVGIIGPNGGGKTTLFKIIMGFLPPLSGKVAIFGHSPITLKEGIAYVPQSMRYDRQFPISVMELVLSGRLSQLPWHGQYSSADKLAAQQALHRVGIAHLQHQAFGTLSGGQAQRALIARALVSNPKLLLLDEPTASVDSQAEADIYALLNELRGTMTILMVTHDLRAAVDQVERVICVQGTAMVLHTSEVCEHFALGLYHTPLQQTQHTKLPVIPTSKHL
jgi:zinc transport system ATP-binding protein